MFTIIIVLALLAYSIAVPAQSMLLYGDTNVTITCTLDVNVVLSMSAVLQLAWFLNGVLNSAQMVVTMSTVSLDLTLGVVNVTDAGVYTCDAMLTDSLGVMINVSTNHTVTVQCEFMLRMLTCDIFKITTFLYYMYT